MVSPSFANSDLTYWLDGYLLKSGIIPNDFPFRAKMVNNFILFASPILSFIISLIVLTKSTDEESIRNLIQNGGKGFFI
ncbi:MAG: hypothetical protein Q4G42_04985 [Neisseria sp.]|nr:hypothetical protein [Neisseria sp.]